MTVLQDPEQLKNGHTSPFDPSNIKIVDIKAFAGQAVVDGRAILDGFTGANMDPVTLAALTDFLAEIENFANEVLQTHGALDDAVRYADHVAHMRVYGGHR